jgi:hypothetical protein
MHGKLPTVQNVRDRLRTEKKEKWQLTGIHSGIGYLISLLSQFNSFHPYNPKKKTFN